MSSASGNYERTKRVLIEGLVIVVSILLAFSIDAWWDRTQEAAAEAEWVAAVQVDLESTLVQLEEGMSIADSARQATRLVVQMLSSPTTPRVDSLRQITRRMITPIFFTPTLPGFERGFSEGRFSGIESVEFRRGLADFRQWLEHFQTARQIDWDHFFTGPLYDVRAPRAGLQFLNSPWRERFRMSDEGYLEAMLEPETFAAIETMLMAQQNQFRGLSEMKAAIEVMISALEGRAR